MAPKKAGGVRTRIFPEDAVARPGRTARSLQKASSGRSSRGRRGAGFEGLEGLLLPPPDLTRRMAETIEVSTRALSA